MREMLARDAAEVRETDFCRLSARPLAFQERKLELDLVTLARLPGFEIPLACIGTPVGTPAKSDCAVGQHDLAGLVERDRFPFRVVGLVEAALEIGRAHIAV